MFRKQPFYNLIRTLARRSRMFLLAGLVSTSFHMHISQTNSENERDSLQGLLCICLRRGLWPKGIFWIRYRMYCLLTFRLWTWYIGGSSKWFGQSCFTPFFSLSWLELFSNCCLQEVRETLPCLKKKQKKPYQYYHISDSVNIQTFFAISICLSCGFSSLVSVFAVGSLVQTSCVSLVLTQWKKMMFDAIAIYIRVTEAKYAI